MKRLTLHISADHPTSAGHFPGNPIIPGALLLAKVLRSIGDDAKVRFSSCNIKSAKFQYPVRPGDNVEIDYSYSAQSVIDFHCSVAETRVLSGTISATIDA